MVAPGSTPVAQAKIVLMSAIRTRIISRYQVQAEAGRALGIEAGMICRLCDEEPTRHLDRFSIDWLLATTARLGGRIRFVVE